MIMSVQPENSRDDDRMRKKILIDIARTYIYVYRAMMIGLDAGFMGLRNSMKGSGAAGRG
jgi:hypothetical protein